MSSLRSEDKVCSTFLKSEWTWRAGTCLWGDGRGVCAVQNGPQEHTGMFVSDAHALSTHWSQKASEDGAGPAAVRADALRCSAFVCPRVLQSVVLLSDSQLHLFLQSQLSVPEIEACVQGRSPVSVSDAILRYAMSNCGWAQEERRGSSHLAEGDQPKR